MDSIICTLFEGNYHYGVATLINSLYKSGFKGKIYAGYRGTTPTWINNAKPDETLAWIGGSTLIINDTIFVHFLPLETSYHFTNYKPDFLLSVLQVEKNIEAIFYYDPDILQDCAWYNMEKWVNCGIAVCEDIISPKGRLHPIRVGWRNYYKKYGLELNYKSDIYVNGGFVGLRRDDFNFLEIWKKAQEAMADDIGGLQKTFFNGVHTMNEETMSTFGMFSKTDQDALNVALEITDNDISFLTKDAMAQAEGLRIIPHAIGTPKPWNSKIIRHWLSKGRTPGYVEKLYWANVDGPIKVYPKGTIKYKRFKIKLVSFLGRFYINKGTV